MSAAQWESFTRAVVRHVLTDETRQAVCAVAATRLAGDPNGRCDIATISAACKAIGARTAPVAAAFGWLRLFDTKRGWVDVTKHSGTVGLIPIDDIETVALFAIFRGAGERIVSMLATSAPGRSTEYISGCQATFAAQRESVELAAERTVEEREADAKRLEKLRAMAPQIEAAMRVGAWTSSESDVPHPDEEERASRRSLGRPIPRRS